MILHLPNLTLRPFLPGDVESLARHANNRRVWQNLRDGFPHPYTEDDARRWVTHAAGQPDPQSVFAIVKDELVIGGIGVHRLDKDPVYRDTAELGYWLAEPYWGRGLMTQAVKAVTRYAFDELGLFRLEAGVFGWNVSSARVLEKAGYSLEGRLRKQVYKDGQRLDVLLYSRLRTDEVE
jgi:RimJ/RimL family protein N-acetyltransferase|uniref:Ribosomal-protein-L7p-serine acetyltransferase n=1 Tax=uncultured bacterium A1Q1_fos_2386 TaxID=1256568 RepID=L7VVU1_9BACT|nr:ribosomal-protein-L7p-serine acetyltransferase [uncultured bacterium A1Q1_fos_2386]